MKKSTKISAAALSVTMVGMATFPLANAAEISEDIRISNYESVSATMSSTGEVTDAIIVDQLTILGNGQVAVANPVANDAVRNLSTFEKLASTGGVLETTVDVNGSQELRTLNDYEGDLPVTLSAKYFLDGEEIDPNDIDKVTGHLEVQYTVTNQTGQLEEISYVNAAGETVTKEVMIYTPIAGEFVTDLPSSFSNAAAAGAAVAADGRGNTKIKWSLTLLPPLSAPETTFSYTADLVDATLPASNLTVIPVKPYENSTAASAVGSYENGSEAGSTIYAGGSAMNDGLGQLADGAGTLMSGISQLYAGSGELKDGLETMQGAVQMLDKLDAFNMVVDGLAKISANNDKITSTLKSVSEQIAGLQADLTAAIESVNTAKSAATAGKETVAGLGLDEAAVAEINGILDGIADELVRAESSILGAQDKSRSAAGSVSSLTKPLVGPTSQIASSVKMLTGVVDMLGDLILGTMADGVNQLADGSVQLNDGLAMADSNMPVLMAGIDKLTNEGAREFMASGLETQMEYEELVTQVAAAAKRTDNGALPVGAPEGAHVASAAYVFDIDGAETEGLSPMALAGIAAGIFAAAGIGLAVANRRRG